MGVLSELMEKKDLKAYCKFRLSNLQHELENGSWKKAPEKTREGAKRQLEGRIAEIKLLSARADGLKKFSIREAEHQPKEGKTK